MLQDAIDINPDGSKQILVNYDRARDLFESHHSRHMTERHVSVLKKLQKIYASRNFLLDIDSLVCILNLSLDKILEGINDGLPELLHALIELIHDLAQAFEKYCMEKIHLDASLIFIDFLKSLVGVPNPSLSAKSLEVIIIQFYKDNFLLSKYS
jgi:hypothetical protein